MQRLGHEYDVIDNGRWVRFDSTLVHMPAPLPAPCGGLPWCLGELQPSEPHFFTDGSGCHQRCVQKLAAWAYVQFSAAGELLAMAANVLTEPQAFESTVYEAELRALQAVVLHTSWDISVGTDNAAVFRGWEQGPGGPATRQGMYASVWQDIWLHTRYRSLTVYKIKAHQPQPAAQAGYHAWKGNQLADHYAGRMLGTPSTPAGCSLGRASRPPHSMGRAPGRSSCPQGCGRHPRVSHGLAPCRPSPFQGHHVGAAPLVPETGGALSLGFPQGAQTGSQG
eukprot:3696768-Amphidinium_carterae.2